MHSEMLAANHKFCCKPQKGTLLLGSFWARDGVGAHGWCLDVADVSAPGASLASCLGRRVGFSLSWSKSSAETAVQLERKIVSTCIWIARKQSWPRLCSVPRHPCGGASVSVQCCVISPRCWFKCNRIYQAEVFISHYLPSCAWERKLCLDSSSFITFASNYAH